MQNEGKDTNETYRMLPMRQTRLPWESSSTNMWRVTHRFDEVI